jgi:hypothetical protein
MVVAKTENQGPRPDTEDNLRRGEPEQQARAMTQRQWDDANAPTDRERRRRFRDRWSQTHLPNLPLRPGWHRFWASESHSTDTPARRIALGYRVLQLSDLEGTGWAPEQGSVKDGQSVDGVVRWREMIGMEIPEEHYQEYMREFHHDQPMDMVRDIYAPLDAMASEIRERGGHMEFGDGDHNLRRRVRPDKQFE